jgi:threonine/homoserine/homoserine lactone efflux protein
MPAIELLIPFFVATAVFACIPGPGLLYAAARTMAHGRDAGWQAAIGLHLGGYAHVLAAAFGLAALLNAVPVLYSAVKIAGACYLIWLGYRMFIAEDMLVGADLPADRTAPRRALSQSILVELLNPKTALFFLAFLPQFTDLTAAFPIWLQILILGTIVNVMFSATDIACVLLSHRAMRLLAASRTANRLAQRIGGGVLIALGVNLAASRQ